MRPTTRRTLESSMRHRPPVTRELRRRQLPTVTSHAVPTGECQSDPPSLLRTLRCSRPRGKPLDRASPLDVLLHIRAHFGGCVAVRLPNPELVDQHPPDWAVFVVTDALRDEVDRLRIDERHPGRAVDDLAIGSRPQPA